MLLILQRSECPAPRKHTSLISPFRTANVMQYHCKYCNDVTLHVIANCEKTAYKQKQKRNAVVRRRRKAKMYIFTWTTVGR